MAYTTWDRLKFTGISGIYSTIMTDIPASDKTITFNFMPCTDHDNNNYPIVEIGNQTWMAINLKTTTYNNGDLIGTTTPATLAIWNEPSPKYQWVYAGEESNVALYGRLYTWYAVTDSRSVCPAGWYVSTDGDWTILTTFLGSEDAGGKLKETGTTHWTIPNVYATDKAGFTALPGGRRNGYGGAFWTLGTGGFWWSATVGSLSSNAWRRGLSYYYNSISRFENDWKDGYSIRCLKVSVPKVTTASVETFGATTATVGGEVITHGGATVTDRGVYYGTTQNPVTTGMKLQIGSGEGTFETNISGLIPNTTYYVTAYVTNNVGTSYGDEESFKTEPTWAVLTTTEVTAITQTTAISGGNITYDGGTDVTARGVCWSTGQYPNLYSNHTSDGTGSGVFISNLTGLTINTKYYIRAYAINSVGYQYGDQRTFATKGATGTVTDVDGNTYSTIQIGTQTWMAENLKTTKFNGGASIHNITDDAQWESRTTAAYCWYNNDINNKNIYGALYNYYAVTVNGGVLCPTGWHVPTDAEWTTLTDYLGGLDEGGKLKETGTTHWISPNTGATNESGFTALPGGRRNGYGGAFWTLGTGGFWWSATVGSLSSNAWRRGLSYYYNSISRFENDWKDGYSIRCLKD